MILITGANGKVGRELAKRLSTAGVEARALVRDLGRAEPLRLSHIRLIEGDLLKPATIDNALEGVDKLFLVAPLNERQVEMENNILEAAKRGNVKHIVKLSVFEPDSYKTRILNFHRQVERWLDTVGIPSTRLRPNFFFQNLLMMASNIFENGAIYLPARDGRLGMVDVRDIADVAFKTLTEPGHEGKVYEITGPETLSLTDVANRLAKFSGREIKYVNITPEEARKHMSAAGMNEWFIDTFLDFYDCIGRGYGGKTTDTVKRLLGRDPIRLDTFLVDNKQVLLGKVPVGSPH